MLLPALSRAKEKAKAIQCLSNKRQLGFAMLLYTEDHEESLINLAVRDNDATDKVVTDDRQEDPLVADLLKSYSQDRQVNQCPSVTTAWIRHWAQLSRVKPLASGSG